MTLKINSMYDLPDGRHIIPRSHWAETETPNWAVFEVLIGGGEHFIKKTTTMSKKEIKQALGLAKNERVDLI